MCDTVVLEHSVAGRGFIIRRPSRCKSHHHITHSRSYEEIVICTYVSSSLIVFYLQISRSLGDEEQKTLYAKLGDILLTQTAWDVLRSECKFFHLCS